jgi:hypothetical protein
VNKLYSMFTFSYRAGLQILRIDDIAKASMTQVGHFDIAPSISSNGYNGEWSTYPYFPSSRVEVSEIEQGLYVLESSVPPASPSTSPSVVPSVAPTSQPTIGTLAHLHHLNQ